MSKVLLHTCQYTGGMYICMFPISGASVCVLHWNRLLRDGQTWFVCVAVFVVCVCISYVHTCIVWLLPTVTFALITMPISLPCHTLVVLQPRHVLDYVANSQTGITKLYCRLCICYVCMYCMCNFAIATTFQITHVDLDW